MALLGLMVVLVMLALVVAALVVALVLVLRHSMVVLGGRMRVALQTLREALVVLLVPQEDKLQQLQQHI